LISDFSSRKKIPINRQLIRTDRRLCRFIERPEPDFPCRGDLSPHACAGEWYAYDYSDDVLQETAKILAEAGPERLYVFFNNDAMLENARLMRRYPG